MGCYILSPLKKLCPQSLGRILCNGCRVDGKVRVFLLHLVFTLPGELRTSLRVPAYFDNQNTTLLQTLDLTLHNLDGFFDEVQFVVHLDFIQRVDEYFDYASQAYHRPSNHQDTDPTFDWHQPPRSPFLDDIGSRSRSRSTILTNVFAHISDEAKHLHQALGRVWIVLLSELDSGGMLDPNIIDEYNHKSIQIWFAHLVHQVHEDSRWITLAFRPVLIDTVLVSGLIDLNSNLSSQAVNRAALLERLPEIPVRSVRPQVALPSDYSSDFLGRN
ncbi:hypothetical protein Tco_1027882 [Tanacetum coccineum]